MIFTDRAHAGRLLGERLLEVHMKAPLLLALPRGGVPVAAEAARILGAPLEVLVVRKLGVLADSLANVISREKKELERRVKLYRKGRTLPSLKGRTAVIVDDGIAMGVTARVACNYARSQGALKVILAVPVCSARTADMLREQVDEFVCLHEPDLFQAVGEFFENFEQTSDREVIELLGAQGKGHDEVA